MNEYLESYLKTISKYDESHAGEAAEKNPKLSIANSMWIKEDPKLKVEEDFITTNEKTYNAGIFKTIFDDAARIKVNKWIEENTGGTIKDMLSELPEDAIMLLVNALAFEGEWAEQYESHQVSPDVFYGVNGDNLAEFMTNTEGRYLRDTNASGFIKPYYNGNLAFAALLPDEGVDIDEYIDSLTGSKLSAVLSRAEEHDVVAKIPKFETESDTSLANILKIMGAKDAFDRWNADFSRLGTYEEDDANIYIGDVLHKTYIKVSERGTKAGAATVVGMAVATSALDKEEPYRVTLDRPFIYMLVDTNENIPLFIGVLKSL